MRYFLFFCWFCIQHSTHSNTILRQHIIFSYFHTQIVFVCVAVYVLVIFAEWPESMFCVNIVFEKCVFRAFGCVVLYFICARLINFRMKSVTHILCVNQRFATKLYLLITASECGVIKINVLQKFLANIHPTRHNPQRIDERLASNRSRHIIGVCAPVSFVCMCV